MLFTFVLFVYLFGNCYMDKIVDVFFDWNQEAKSNDVMYSEDYQMWGRVKRASYTPSKMSYPLKILIVEAHNSYRRMEGASNMQKLVSFYPYPNSY